MNIVFILFFSKKEELRFPRWKKDEKTRGEISYAQAAGAVKQEKAQVQQPNLRNIFRH